MKITNELNKIQKREDCKRDTRNIIKEMYKFTKVTS